KVPSFGGGGGGQGGLEIIGKLMKLLGPLLGLEMPVTKPRGYLGIELDESKDGVTIKKVIPSTPADEAGLKPGDKLLKVSKDNVNRIEAVMRSAAKTVSGKELVLVIERDGVEKKIAVKLGKGL